MPVIAEMGAAVAAAAAIPVRNVATWSQWSPTAVGIWSLLGTLLTLIAVLWPKLRKINVDAITAMNIELMRRITELETTQRKDHQECYKAYKALNDEFDEYKRRSREHIEGLQRQIISFQVASGQPFPLHLSPETRKMVDKLMGAMSEDRPPRRSLMRRRRRK